MKTKNLSVVRSFILSCGVILSVASPARAENAQPVMPQGTAAGQEQGHVHTEGDGHDHGQAPAAESPAQSPEQAFENFKLFAQRIPIDTIAELPLQSHGRLKPFDSFAREIVLYITGKYSKGGLDASQLYLGLMVSDLGPRMELINLRDPQLRTALGFSKKDRYVSVQMLEKSPLEELAKPAIDKSQRGDRNLNPQEKAALEAIQQLWATRGVITGRHLLEALTMPTAEKNAQPAQPNPAVYEKAQQYLQALSSGDMVRSELIAKDLVAAARTQPIPELLARGVNKMGTEVFYNHAHLFRWAGFLYFVIGLLLVLPVASLKKLQQGNAMLYAAGVPFLLHIAGFALRVYITGFAPVTNMYGTMVWVAFGVVLFGGFLYMAYRNPFVWGFILLGAAGTLFLTESLPLVLSPDMDPIVAVLRSNFWLTIHVLTITISYAAFTIGMLLGNFALIRGIIADLKPGRRISVASNKKFYDEYGLLAYRVTQIGVFFLTAGIILGGIWADYSWGRFWGWDPKETWSLIADLGYLAILHAKYLGWLGPFGVLAASPVAYLLVIMAWYGVNFILASGLHSYGFSSGGAFMIAMFVGVQLTLLAISMAVHNWKKQKGTAVPTV